MTLGMYLLITIYSSSRISQAITLCTRAIFDLWTTYADTQSHLGGGEGETNCSSADPYPLHGH